MDTQRDTQPPLNKQHWLLTAHVACFPCQCKRKIVAVWLHEITLECRVLVQKALLHFSLYLSLYYSTMTSVKPAWCHYNSYTWQIATQGGGTRACCVLRSLSAVKILTEKFYCCIASIWWQWTFSLKFCFDLDRFDQKLQRDIVAWLLTSKNISSWPLTYILTADEDRSTQHMWVSPPCYLCFNENSSWLTLR